jgi:hypothetical protein
VALIGIDNGVERPVEGAPELHGLGRGLLVGGLVSCPASCIIVYVAIMSAGL